MADTTPPNAIASSVSLDPAGLAALYEQYAPGLRRLVVGVLRDREAAEDVVQATFAKAIQVGHTARVQTRKAWLFRVAYHEALPSVAGKRWASARSSASPGRNRWPEARPRSR